MIKTVLETFRPYFSKKLVWSGVFCGMEIGVVTLPSRLTDNHPSAVEANFS